MLKQLKYFVVSGPLEPKLPRRVAIIALGAVLGVTFLVSLLLTTALTPLADKLIAHIEAGQDTTTSYSASR